LQKITYPGNGEKINPVQQTQTRNNKPKHTMTQT